MTSAELTEYKPSKYVDTVYKCWRLYVRNAIPIYVLKDDEAKRFKRDVTKLGKEIASDINKAKAAYDAVVERLLATDCPSDTLNKHPHIINARDELTRAKEQWSEIYFPFKDAFAEVDFGYALTIHKYQGSTYDSVFIHDDYLAARSEWLQLLYVAVTRAAKEVHHLALPALPVSA